MNCYRYPAPGPPRIGPPRSRFRSRLELWLRGWPAALSFCALNRGSGDSRTDAHCLGRRRVVMSFSVSSGSIIFQGEAIDSSVLASFVIVFVTVLMDVTPGRPWPSLATSGCGHATSSWPWFGCSTLCWRGQSVH